MAKKNKCYKQTNAQGDNFISDKNGAVIAQTQRKSKFHYILDLLKEVEYQVKTLKNTEVNAGN